jgi:hypothetical protein
MVMAASSAVRRCLLRTENDNDRWIAACKLRATHPQWSRSKIASLVGGSKGDTLRLLKPLFGAELVIRVAAHPR